MNTIPIVVAATYDAPVERVWKALTDTAEMKQWYFDIAAFKPENGFKFNFSAGDDKQQYLHRCEVQEAIPNQKLSYTWAYDGYPGETLVTFDLKPGQNCTMIKLTHTGIETFPQGNPSFGRDSFMAGWTEIIGENLKQYVEKAESAQR